MNGPDDSTSKQEIVAAEHSNLLSLWGQEPPPEDTAPTDTAPADGVDSPSGDEEHAEPVSRYHAAIDNPALRVFNETDSFYRHEMPSPYHWSLVWSDLMMTMFILFATMFMFQTAAKRDMLDNGERTRKPIDFIPGRTTQQVTSSAITKPVTQGGPMAESIPTIYAQASKTLKADDMKNFASMELISDQAVRIILTGDLLFDLARSELKPEATEALRKIGELLKKTPYQINVAGHTDSLPVHTRQFATNWELSVMRATVVARFLIETIQIPARQISVTGYADYHPVGLNSTAEGRAANRRVEIIISRDESDGLPADYRKLLEANGGGG